MTSEENNMDDKELLDLLGAALQTLPEAADEAEPVPPRVLDGAMWTHDWLNMDARLAELTFDSLDQPELAGVRSASSLRELTFVSGEYVIELEIEFGPRRAVVSGTIDPQAAAEIELLVGGELFTGTAGSTGAFVIEGLPAGTALAFVAIADQKIRLGSFEI